MMVRRPGHLAGFQGMVPSNRVSSGNTATLGNFGKGMMMPPPGAPPPGAPGASLGGKTLTHAIDKRTKQFYVQDPRCPEGEVYETRNIACKGMDCCDAPGDCDPEGTIYPEADCWDDPNYMRLPPEPPGGFPNCQARAARGYPGPCNQQTCPSCFAPKSQAQPQQQGAQQSAVSMKSPEEEARAAAEAAKLEAELAKIEAEQAQVESMVTQTPTLPTPATYTGGGMPVMTRRREPSTPTTEDKIAALVAKHETKKAMQRSSAAPPQIIRRTEPIKPPPATEGPATPPMAAPRAREDKGGGIFSWLRNALFGPSRSLEGYTLGQEDKKPSSKIIPLLVVIGILYFFLIKP